MSVPSAPSNDYSKLVAGLQGGGGGAALCTIIVWVLDVKGIQMPPEVAVAVASLLTALCSGFGTWLKRETA
jgi:uncharacterized membrane protein YfcA